jgi:hypothetical protein
MTRDDIVKMAREAKLPYEYDTGRVLHLKELEHFAALIEERIHTNNKARWYQEGVEAECEAFIALIENYAQSYAEPTWAFDLIKKIRARGER